MLVKSVCVLFILRPVKVQITNPRKRYQKSSRVLEYSLLPEVLSIQAASDEERVVSQRIWPMKSHEVSGPRTSVILASYFMSQTLSIYELHSDSDSDVEAVDLYLESHSAVAGLVTRLLFRMLSSRTGYLCVVAFSVYFFSIFVLFFKHIFNQFSVS